MKHHAANLRVHLNERGYSSSVAKRGLRIAFCFPKITGGADLIQQKTIASSLQDRGHQLTILAPLDLENVARLTNFEVSALLSRTWSNSFWFKGARKGTWNFQKLLGIPYLNVFSNLSHYDAYMRCLPGHDIVHERNGLYRSSVASACKRLKIPYVLFFDADDIFELDYLGQPVTGVLRLRAQQIIRHSLSAASAIITVSEATRRRLVEVWNVPEKKIALFPNCVDVHQFQPCPEMRTQVRESLGIGNSPLILYVGNFYAWHDTTTLLKGFAEYLRICPTAQLVLVGDGTGRQATVRISEELAIDRAVKFLGLVDRSQIPALMSAADVLVSPYPKMTHAWWGSSMKLFEYLASGTAVIASNIGEQVTAVIDNERNGLLVPPEDPSALAGCFQRLMSDDALRSHLGRQGRKDAVEKYSLEHYMLRIENLYHAVLEKQNVYAV